MRRYDAFEAAKWEESCLCWLSHNSSDFIRFPNGFLICLTIYDSFYIAPSQNLHLRSTLCNSISVHIYGHPSIRFAYAAKGVKNNFCRITVGVV